MPGKTDRNIWEQAQDHLQTILDDHSFDNWLSETEYQSYHEGKLTVAVPTAYCGQYIRNHFMETIRDCVRKLRPETSEVDFVHLKTPRKAKMAEDIALAQAASAPRPRPKAPAPRTINGFNPRYTFDNFVIGSGNRFPHAAARAVAESPGKAYNPLFLYGDTGLGKTHLMQAVGQEILRRAPQLSVKFVTSEQFTNEFIESIAKKSTHRFKERYRRVDVLLIDDIHFIAGKEGTQEEVFHTFNALFDNHKQIVLSSDRGPKEIQGLETRLVTRFEWGLVTDIHPPDLETRMAILQSKAKHEGHDVPEVVIEYIAKFVTTSVRELEGALITTLAYARLTERKLTTQLVDEVLRDLIRNEQFRPVTIEAVMRTVAQHFDVRIAELRGRSRTRQIAFPRQVAMHLCKSLIPGLSLKDIGEAFGGKDHTTVLYACDKVATEAKESTNLRQTLDELIKKIRTT